MLLILVILFTLLSGSAVVVVVLGTYLFGIAVSFGHSYPNWKEESRRVGPPTHAPRQPNVLSIEKYQTRKGDEHKFRKTG